MERFWKGLMRVNARLFAFVAGAGLLAVAGWAVREHRAAERNEALSFAAPVDPEPTDWRPDAHDVLSPTGAVKRNPFASSFLGEFELRELQQLMLRQERDGLAAAGNAATDSFANTALAAVDAAAGEPAAAVELTLVYQGLLQRTDGSVVAVVYDEEGDRSQLFTRGDTIGDLRVSAITRDVLELDGPAHEHHVLRAGETTTLRTGLSRETRARDQQPATE